MNSDDNAASQTSTTARDGEPDDRPKRPVFRLRVVLAAVLAGILIMDIFSTAGILPGLLFGGQSRSREMARRAACMDNVKLLAMLLRNYAETNSIEGKTLSDMAAKIPELHHDPRLMRCPTTPSFQYKIDAAGLTDPDHPLIFELPGTHPVTTSWSLFGRSLPAAHCECRMVEGKIIVRFVVDE